MSIALWILFGALVILAVVLIIYIFLMRKSADEIQKSVSEIISTDTNILITVSSRDKHIRALSDTINRQLRILRNERHKLGQGDNELKEAVTNISHDIRTPLTAIHGYLDLIMREDMTQKQKQYLEIIKNRADALSQLTQELFKYSVIISENDEAREEVNVNSALEDSLVSFYGAMTQKGMIPDIKICDKAVVRSLNSSSLSRIFNNIISNAIKYSDGDFKVDVDEYGTINFSNTASGLDAVTVAKLFDRFYTVESGRNSTGLGLSIARLLTERMGGTITADFHGNVLSIMLSFPD